MPNQIDLDFRLRALNYLNGATWMDANPNYDLNMSKFLSIPAGSAVGEVDQIYARRRSLASGATEVLDLNGAALKDAFGVNLSFLTLCLVMIINEDTPNADGTPATPNTTNLTIGAGTNQIPNILGSSGATKIMRPGDLFFSCNFGASGIALLTPGTADEFQIVNGAGATANYRIIFAGRST